MKHVEIPGGRGGVVVADGESATVSTRADGSHVVNLANGARVTFMSVNKTSAPASGHRSSKPKDISPKAVLARVIKPLSEAERKALAQVFLDAGEPVIKRLKDRQRELEAEVALLKSRLAAQ